MVPKAGLGLGCRDLPAGLGGSHLVDPVDHLRCRGAGNRPGTGWAWKIGKNGELCGVIVVTGAGVRSLL